MRHAVFCGLIVLPIVAGCQSTGSGYVALVATDRSSQVEQRNASSGQVFVLSRQKTTVVAAGLGSDQTWSEYGTPVLIKIKNNGKKTIVFGSKDLVVSNGPNRLLVLDYDGIQAAIGARQQQKEATAVFAAVAGGLGAGLYAGSSSANAAVASIITQQVVASAQASGASLANSKQEAETLTSESGTFLSQASVPPGGTYGGLILVADNDAGESDFTVNVGGDIHVFSIK